MVYGNQKFGNDSNFKIGTATIQCIKNNQRFEQTLY